MCTVTGEGCRRHNPARKLPVETDKLVLNCYWMRYLLLSSESRERGQTLSLSVHSGETLQRPVVPPSPYAR